LVWIKWWLLAIPHYIIVAVFQGGGKWKCGLVSILTLISAIVLLFTGKYPESLFKLIIGMNRWSLRVGAYASLMTDDYPPFRFDE
jgi:hypothetical protein